MAFNPGFSFRIRYSDQISSVFIQKTQQYFDQKISQNNLENVIQSVVENKVLNLKKLSMLLPSLQSGTQHSLKSNFDSSQTVESHTGANDLSQVINLKTIDLDNVSTKKLVLPNLKNSSVLYCDDQGEIKGNKLESQTAQTAQTSNRKIAVFSSAGLRKGSVGYQFELNKLFSTESSFATINPQGTFVLEKGSYLINYIAIIESPIDLQYKTTIYSVNKGQIPESNNFHNSGTENCSTSTICNSLSGVFFSKQEHDDQFTLLCELQHIAQDQDVDKLIKSLKCFCQISVEQL